MHYDNNPPTRDTVAETGRDALRITADNMVMTEISERQRMQRDAKGEKRDSKQSDVQLQ
jgi:hypothetical protein